jgi:hypothetical protein
MRHMKNLKRIIPVMSSSREAKCEFFTPPGSTIPAVRFYIYIVSVPAESQPRFGPPGSSEGYPTPTLDGDGGQVLVSSLICCHAQGGGGRGPVPLYIFPAGRTVSAPALLCGNNRNSMHKQYQILHKSGLLCIIV